MNGASARVLHAALVAGVVVMLGAVTLVRQAAAFEGAPLPLSALRLAAFAAAVLALAANRALRMGFPAFGGGRDGTAWWQANGRRVLVVWALAEGTATIGAVLWLLSGDAVVLAVASGVGLLLLLTGRPASFESG
jgi:hypothetical protein